MITDTPSVEQVFASICDDYREEFGRLPAMVNLKSKPLAVARMFGFNVEYVYTPIDELAGYFQTSGDGDEVEPDFHEIVILHGLGREQELFVFWHEIAHGFDFTEMKGLDAGGLRTAVKINHHSSALSPLLKRNATILGCRDNCFHGQFDWHNRWLWFVFGENRPSLIEKAEYARSTMDADTLAYQDSEEELFAEALALSVLNPIASYALDGELHDRLTEILKAEFMTIFPEKIVESFIKPLRAAGEQYRKLLVRYPPLPKVA